MGVSYDALILTDRSGLRCVRNEATANPSTIRPDAVAFVDQVHRANRKNASLVLKVSMEMSKVMRRARFGEHSDDNAKEAA